MTLESNQYLERAVELSKASYDAGEFPAGAVLVTRSGAVYESKPSVPHNHGETMVIDMAIEAEGGPLTGAVMYASMQPCLMCLSKMYWTHITDIEYVIPKSLVKAEYAYESDLSIDDVTSRFFAQFNMREHRALLQSALAVYELWVKKIEK